MVDGEVVHGTEAATLGLYFSAARNKHESGKMRQVSDTPTVKKSNR